MGNIVFEIISNKTSVTVKGHDNLFHRYDDGSWQYSLPLKNENGFEVYEHDIESQELINKLEKAYQLEKKQYNEVLKKKNQSLLKVICKLTETVELLKNDLEIFRND